VTPSLVELVLGGLGKELHVDEVDAEAGPGALEADGEVTQLTHLLHLVIQELPLQEVREVRVLLLRRQPRKVTTIFTPMLLFFSL